MPEFRYHSARAVCATADNGISTVNFYGMVDQKGMAFLRSCVHEYTRPARAVIARLDGALLMLDRGFLEGANAAAHDGPDVAVIVSDEHYEMGMAYARRMAGIGVKRLIFLPSQILMARRWAECRARSKSEELLLSQH